MSGPNKVNATTETASLTKKAKKIAYFFQKLSVAAQKVEEAAVDYAIQFPVKYNLLLSALEDPSLENITVPLDGTPIHHLLQISSSHYR